MKITTLCILGTRPEAIKMAPVIKMLNGDERFYNKLCITSQHHEMLYNVLNLFKIVADFDLNVMSHNQDLSSLSALILEKMTSVFASFNPDCVLVHGDTTTTLMAALSAYYHKIPIVHVEAGLRTRDIYAPWPEEANRKLTDDLSWLHFAPTNNARLKLLEEGVKAENVYVTGNTVIDALLDICQTIDNDNNLQAFLAKKFQYLKKERKVILVTLHRRENFGDGFRNICFALQKIAKLYPDVDIVLPMHLNPNVQNVARPMLENIFNVYLIKPVDYLSFVYLMRLSYIILTDSGGIQEEAPSLGKPVIVVREKTERPEALEAGTVILGGTNQDFIIEKVCDLLENKQLYSQMSTAFNPYGDGFASNRIVNILLEKFQSLSLQSKVCEEKL